MKVLLATPLYSSRHLDAGIFWLRALNRLGYAAAVWDYRLDPAPPPFEYDFTIVLKGQEINPDTLPHPRVIYWPDDLDRTPGIEQILRQYDRVYTCVRPTPPGMEWIPTGWDPGIHRPLGLGKSLDVVFIGTYTEYKARMLAPFIRDATQYNKAIYGNGWEGIRSWGSGWMGRAIYLHEYVEALSAARISLNVHREPGIGLNRRFFESMAVTFTLTDVAPGVSEVLGPELFAEVGFDCPEEAAHKVTYFLNHAKEREELWRAEREAIRPYTYLEAARRILES